MNINPNSQGINYQFNPLENRSSSPKSTGFCGRIWQVINSCCSKRSKVEKKTETKIDLIAQGEIRRVPENRSRSLAKERFSDVKDVDSK